MLSNIMGKRVDCGGNGLFCRSTTLNIACNILMVAPLSYYVNDCEVYLFLNVTTNLLNGCEIGFRNTAVWVLKAGLASGETLVQI